MKKDAVMQAIDLQAYRGRRDLTQAALAKQINADTGRSYNKTTISRWEAGTEAIPDIVSAWLAIRVPARIIGFTNQKGGVAKTTSAINIAYSISTQGYKVLLVDADPQANATEVAGLDSVDLDERGRTIHHLLFEARRPTIGEVIVKTEHFDVLPSGQRLSKGEKISSSLPNADGRLAKALGEIRAAYDFIIIDCPPNLGVMTISALTAATHIVIPCPPARLDFNGVKMLMPEIDEAAKWANPGLKVLGIIPTRFREKHAVDQRLLAEMREFAGEAMRVFPPVPETTDVQKAIYNGAIPLAVVRRDHPIHIYHKIAEEIVALSLAKQPV